MLTFSDHLVLHQLLLSKRQLGLSIIGLIIASIIGFKQLKISKDQQTLAEWTFRVVELQKSIKDLEDALLLENLGNRQEVEIELEDHKNFLLKLLKKSPLNKNPFDS